MMVTFWNNLLDPVGREQELGWTAVARMLREPNTFRGANEQPGWSPATFRDQRRAKDGVKKVFAVCLDYDGGETIEAATELWGGFAGVIQTTRKHTPEAPRFRVVLPLSRSVSPFEFAALWARVSAHAGGKLDPAPKDPSRFWFMPGTPEGGVFESKLLTGDMMDPDEWLAKPDPTPKMVAARIDNSDLDRSDRRIKRAARYLETMAPAISGSRGHQATWKAALALVKGFSLRPTDALALLVNDFNPRCTPPWPMKDLERKIAQAGKADQVTAGYLLGDEEEWERKQAERQRRHAENPETGNEDFGEAEDYAAPIDLPDEPMREPGDDTEEIEQERKAPVTALERFGVITLRTMYRTVLEDLQNGKDGAGYMLGIDEIDAALGGFRRGNVTLLAAGTNFGKSSLAILAVRQNLSNDARPLIISVEDRQLLYARRIAASECNINALLLRDREVKGESFKRLVDRAHEAPDLPIFIDAVGKTVEWAAEAIRACAAELGTKLVIADYVGRFKCGKNISDRRNQVTYVAETLSDAIKVSNCAGVLLSQLKRTEGKEPTMDDVKESGDLENMAEHVVIGWREVTKGNGVRDAEIKRKCNIPKNKDGPIEQTWIPLAFDDTTARFLTTKEARLANRDASGYGDYDGIADNVRRYGN